MISIRSYKFYLFIFLIVFSRGFIFGLGFNQKEFIIDNKTNEKYFYKISNNDTCIKVYLYSVKTEEVIDSCNISYRIEFDQCISVSNYFICLQIKQPGGTGKHVRSCLLLCSSNGKLNKSIEFISIDNAEIYNTLQDTNFSFKQKYEVKLLKYDNDLKKALFQENLWKYDDIYKNFKTIQDTIELLFDENKNIFYTEKSTCSGIIYSNNYEDENSQIINNEEAYIVKFKEHQYFYIKNSWYIRYEKDSYLYKL